MGGITTGVGLFSGIDSASLIDQLINIQSRPKIFAQQRIINLKSQQAAYLDINSRLSAFKTAAAAFRVDNIFSARSVSSSDETVLNATASSAAVPGSYNFIIDRLVSTQQALSRGFADSSTSAIGLGSLTFESEAARLDNNTALADLNNGNGATRGKITINGTIVDLSTAGTVGEVIDAISAVSGVSARVENDHFVLSGVTSATQDNGAGILESLGLGGTIGGTTLTGTSVFSLNTNTALQSLNDGRGVAIRQASGVGVEDFTITIDPNGVNQAVKVRIGEIQGDDGSGNIITLQGEVSTIGGVIDRINTALSDAGFSEFTASINTTTGGIDIVDSLNRDFDIANQSSGSVVVTTAEDLGLVGSYTGGSASGTRILAGLNTKLVSSLNGGTGLGATDGVLNFVTQDGSAGFAINVSGLNDINDIINTINNDATNAGRVSAKINTNGTGIEISDTTTGSTTFAITGTGGSDTAAALGVSGSFTNGISGGSNLQLAYIGNASLLSELNNGAGIGTGTFEIIDAQGNRAEVTIASSDKTIADVLKSINSSISSGQPAQLEINARINDNGDGIVIEESASGANGAQAITISNVTGTVASKLGIAGTASGIDASNFIDGSFEEVVTFAAGATLDDIRNSINAANIGVSASIINSGIGTNPFRLNLTSEHTGEDGRFLVDTGGFDLGLSTLDVGNDARVFFGSSDPANGVLLSSSTNQLDGVVQGVTIDLFSRSDTPVELSVTTDTPSIESKVSDFVSAYNTVLDGIDFRTRFDADTKDKGILLGDGTLLNLRNGMASTIRHANDGFSGEFNTLNEVGVTVGTGGKLEFDKEKFRAAYAQDPQAVEDLFARQALQPNPNPDPNVTYVTTFSEQSVLGQLEQFADAYVSSIGGVLQARNDALDSQIKIQEDRIVSIQKSLDNKRIVLQRQFLAMEQAIGSFQTQGASIAQLSSLG